MASEFQIGEYSYKAGKIDTFRAFDVLRKLSPVLAAGIGELVPLLAELRESGVAGMDLASIPQDRAFAAIQPVANALAKLPDEDSRFIIGVCLSVAERQPITGGAWVRIWNEGAGRASFEDINGNLAVTLQIVGHVIWENYRDFFPALLSD